jgi:hypothetical protein
MSALPASCVARAQTPPRICVVVAYHWNQHVLKHTTIISAGWVLPVTAEHVRAARTKPEKTADKALNVSHKKSKCRAKCVNKKDHVMHSFEKFENMFSEVRNILEKKNARRSAPSAIR